MGNCAIARKGGNAIIGGYNCDLKRIIIPS